MYYEINVSLKGSHYFATAKRSIRDLEIVKEVYKHFVRVFPASEGYAINVTQYSTIGESVSTVELLTPP